MHHKIFGIKMSGKVSGRGSYQFWGGRGGQGGQGRCRTAIEYNSSGYTTKHKGICSDLRIHVFEYCHKASSDQMRTT